MGLLLEPGRHGTIALLAGVAVDVELEQHRRQSLAAIVTLAFVLIDADLELSGAGLRLSQLLKGASNRL
jgi:hypothetical protein